MKFLTLLALCATHVFAASQLALFTDDACQNSLRGLEGPNGYPNGTCTDLRRTGPYGSFQVVGLDPGCTVTIYQNDTTENICSGYQEVIQPIDCYNSSFVYYSIDFCDIVSTQSPIAPHPPSSGSSGISTGAAVGATLGGVAGLAIIGGLIAFFVLKKRREARRTPEVAEYPPSMPSEVHAKHLHEMGPGAVVYKRDAAVEVEQPAVELEGRELGTDEESRTLRS
ncbi:hypothetical protein COCMIDRAFT_79905 [Bipolaris oryzae ATCC 44560]|uniref:Uncharacterized protein n=1 Tax=Bipolaris oryzae ATCC 44560 TaxID=930090 RepID=W7A573_COCMI|nr:uncharacterized protein COCMIDRAFT_79905 [Bipolaris oryzae ATCC 44560]EUC51256.1 hypothetical protein COCMIDRAFT_79905 [Bipolaris oryzae ATCC 44560]